MDRRPKRRIWNGDDYESDLDEDQKPRNRSLNNDSQHMGHSGTRLVLVIYLKELRFLNVLHNMSCDYV